MSKNVKIIAGILGVIILLVIVYMLYSKSKAVAPKPATGSNSGGSSNTLGTVSSLLSSAFNFGSSVAATQTGSNNSGGSGSGQYANQYTDQTGQNIYIQADGAVVDAQGNKIGTDDGNGTTYTDLYGSTVVFS